MASSERVAAVRAFNRFYTGRIGLLKGGLHRTAHALPEARVLYELGASEQDVADLREALEMDAGQLSRLLGKLEGDGLVARERSPHDGRRQHARLTPRGQEAFAILDARSAQEIGELLDGLGEDRQRAAVTALSQLQRALDGGERDVLLRGLEPGDLGWMVERHGALYAQEYGWDQSFERLVAKIAAAFDPAHDHAWIAEVDGMRAGCVLLVHDTPANAKLRTLLVEPQARGLGLGSQLVDRCIETARDNGYETLTLWTNDVLHAARRIYERAGFVKTSEAAHHAFGHDLVEQTWSLTLRP
jgi:DNA-binding MarR family transcriptional regulator/GNAT superfamily N-acetyltransferase